MFDETPPDVVIAGPAVVEEDTVVEYSSELTTDNDPTLRDWKKGTFEWSFAGGNGFESTSVNERGSVIFPDPGIYSVTLKVTDPAGNYGSLVKMIEVLDVTPPEGSILGPPNGDLGFRLVYWADLSDNDPSFSEDSNYLWTLTLDDNTSDVRITSVLESFDHIFDISGNYTLKLVVTDGSGNELTRERSIYIKPDTPQSTDGTVEEGDEIPYLIIFIIAAVVLLIIAAAFIMVKSRRGEETSDVEWEDDDDDESDDDDWDDEEWDDE